MPLPVNHITIAIYRRLPPWLRKRLAKLNSQRYVTGVLAVITDDKGQFLLFCHRYDEPWRLPGGGATGSDLREKLRAELKSESGFEIRVGRMLGVVHGETDYLDYVFEAKIQGGAFRTSDEVSDYGFFALDNLPEGMGARHGRILIILAEEADSWPQLPSDSLPQVGYVAIP